MPAFPDITTIDHALESIKTWLSVNVLAISNLIQITKAPRCNHRRVSEAKKVSTALAQEQEVGVK